MSSCCQTCTRVDRRGASLGGVGRALVSTGEVRGVGRGQQRRGSQVTACSRVTVFRTCTRVDRRGAWTRVDRRGAWTSMSPASDVHSCRQERCVGYISSFPVIRGLNLQTCLMVCPSGSRPDHGKDLFVPLPGDFFLCRAHPFLLCRRPRHLCSFPSFHLLGT